MPNHGEPPSDLHEVRARINAAISAPRVTSREPAPDLDSLAHKYRREIDNSLGADDVRALIAYARRLEARVAESEAKFLKETVTRGKWEQRAERAESALVKAEAERDEVREDSNSHEAMATYYQHSTLEALCERDDLRAKLADAEAKIARVRDIWEKFREYPNATPDENARRAIHELLAILSREMPGA